MIGRGVATRIALAALASAGVGLAILAIGVTVVGADVFRSLMADAGVSADHAQAMYDQSVTTVVLAAVVVAAIASIALAIFLARMLTHPIAEIGAAARRIAAGDYAARVPRGGPEELASLADSFNQMAASLERQEAMRRDFIANAAHELRTPLTNLQGYLEALRDGVITADRATYDSLWDEAERLVRLSHSLDSLAEGDAASAVPHLVELDLANAIRAALDLAQPTLERAGLRLVVDVPDRLPARANPDHLAQVLANLISNAARYTPAGGTVTVRAERHATDLLVSIVNTGEGIPADDLDRVFERLPRREIARPGARRGWYRARHREAADRGRGRAGRRRIGRRPDAILVQPAELTGELATVVTSRPARGPCYHSEPVARPWTKRGRSWGCSSAGRAPRSHRGGQGFESPHLHHPTPDRNRSPV